MAGDLDRITAERIRDEFSKLLLRRRPGRPGCGCWSTPGWPSVFLPELAGLQLEIDEHAQHKDVYEHTLTVVAQRDPAGGRDGPDFVLRLAALHARHRQAGDQGGRRRTAGSASTTTRWSARG